MSSTTRQTLIRYAASPALVTLIVVFKLLISSFIPDQQAFLLFFAAVTLTTWYGGVGPGLVSAALSAFFANLLFFPPEGIFDTTASVLFQILLFFLESLFVVGLANALRERRLMPSQTMTIPSLGENRQENALALLETFQVYAPVGLAFLDNDLRYIRINYAMAEPSGLTPAVYIGKQLHEVQPGMNPEMLRQIQQVAVTGSPLLDQETTITKQTMLGMRQQHYSTSYYRIRGADGKALGVGAVMVDMTQRKEVEQALRESETLFRTMADTAPVMIWLADADKRRTYFNKGWLDFTGRQMEQETGDGWQVNVHPDDIEQFRQVYEESFENPRPYRREYRLKRFDGQYRWILATGVPRFTSEGIFNGFIGTCIDIDDRKRQEIASQFLVQAGEILAESLDYETTLANVARLAVPTIADWCAVDMLTPSGTVERLAVAHVDPEKVKWAYELQARYPTDMNATSGLPQVLRTGEAEFYPAVTEEMIEGAATDGETYQILREIGFTSVLISPLIARGRTLGALTLVTTESRRQLTETDVRLAEQLASQAALAVDNARLFRETREEQERFRVTLTSVGDAVIATDTQGNITFINQVAEQLTGWHAGEALGKPLNAVLKLIHETTRQNVGNPVEKVLREGRTVSLARHTLLVSREGQETPIEDSGAPIPGDGGSINGVVLVFRDISERRRAEQRQQFLAEASNLLISSIDYEKTLQHITRLAVPDLADSAVVYLQNEDGVPQQAAMSHTDPKIYERRQEMVGKYSPKPTVEFGYLKVMRTGESQLLGEVSDEMLQAAATNEEHLQMLRDLSYQSSISVPLRNPTMIFGALTLNTKQGGRTLNNDDLLLAEELAGVISLAIENARLYRDAQRRGSTPD